MPPKQKEQRLNMNFRVQVSPHNRLAHLVRYYNAGDWALATSRQEIVTSPMDAFWMPFALQHQGMPEAQVRQAALGSLYRLSLHIQLIKNVFNLEPEEMLLPGATEVPEVSQPQPPSQPFQPGNSFDDEVDPNYDGDFRDEDAVLDSIM